MTPPALVVFPVRNEAPRLPGLLAPLLEVTRREGYDLVAIDDASTDASPEILAAHGVRTLRHSARLGYGASVQTGYKYALARGHRRVLQLDGDGQHDPRFLPRIEAALADRDVVIGSRFLPAGPGAVPPAGRLYRGTVARRAGIRAFRLLLGAMSGARVTDPTSGYLGLNRCALEFMVRDRRPYDFPDADVVFSLLRNRYRIAEVPVYMYFNETGGQLHRGLAPLWYMFKVTVSLLVSRLRRLEGREIHG